MRKEAILQTKINRLDIERRGLFFRVVKLLALARLAEQTTDDEELTPEAKLLVIAAIIRQMRSDE